ncbi:MAG: S49 family peptidase [Pseudomonadales bacterium]|nr:S49 family peptidase [Pseudomonadales bacterium]
MFGKKNEDEAVSNSGKGPEWKLLEKVISDSFVEQRRARRWGIFFKLLTFAYIFAFIFLFSNQSGDSMGLKTPKHEYTGLVSLKGVIADGEEANANAIATGLRKAFEHEKTTAVILAINSPGGSPVQSNYVYDEINRLREKYPEKKLYAVIGDLGASGAYYIASAADEIYASESSLVGSIGVTAAGFGFVDALDKLGVERRNFTSGEHKSFLDPFQPVNPSEAEFWKGVLNVTHQQFIKRVKDGRGDRLANDNEQLFSGLIWSGEQALDLGLIDGMGSPGQVAREVIGVEDILDFTVKPNPFEAFTGRLGSSIGSGIASYFHSQASMAGAESLR